MIKFLAISYRIIGALLALHALIMAGVTIGLKMPQWVSLIPIVISISNTAGPYGAVFFSVILPSIMAVGFFFTASFLTRSEYPTFCLLVALATCAFFPVGTVLGACTIWTIGKTVNAQV
jgi:hypothetical protein